MIGYTSTFLRSFGHFMAFELILKLALLAIGAPVLTYMLKFTMKMAGVSYLTDENLLVYIQKPLTLISGILLLFFIGFFTFVEMSALIACFGCYSRHEKITLSGMFACGTDSFKKAFRWSGIPRFMVFMLLMPFVQFTFASGQFMAPMMPILRNIFKSLSNTSVIVAYVLIQALFVILIADKSYSLHYLVLTEHKFKDCIKKSHETIKGKKLEMTFSLLLWSLFMVLSVAVLTFGIGFLAVFIMKGFSDAGKSLKTALKILKYAGRIFMAVSSFLASPAIMCWLTERFAEDTDENIILPERKSHKMKKAPKMVLFIFVASASLLLNITYIQALYKGNINLNVGILTRTQITAHRGFSKVAPENTMYAFTEAVNSDADYIELDVQLTADGQLVVFHDKTIERTTNGKGELSNYTYDELLELSAGSWFSDDGQFDDAKISLLSEVLETHGNDILFNIEIKNHGNVLETAEKTVETVGEYGLERSCYITSFSYKALKRVKQLNPKIKTGLIANIASSTSFTRLKYIDAVSLNYIFINQSIVNMAHQNGKRIFVWTVDNSSDIQHMIALGVDNIITNRPDKALEIVDSHNMGDIVINILEMIFGN